MNNIELAKKALESVDDMSFNCYLYASTGGTCSSGWDDNRELYLSASELLYLISRGFSKQKELFENLDMTEVDVEEKINELAHEGAFPEGGAYASVNGVVPDELEDLGEMLENYDEDAADEIRQRLEDITDGEFTFYFTIKDSFDYVFEEDAEEPISLTAGQVRGLLNGEYGNDELFQDLDCEEADEDLINDKAEELGFAEEYNTFSVGGDCEELDTYLESWETLIEKILAGEVDEDSLDNWLKYFDDSDNYSEGSDDIESWYDDQDFDEEED